MAAPRVFVSSTYYDLKHVRDDIELFLKGLGYIPVMHDKGNVTYPQGDISLEQACYDELSTCDIVICIIGGKYGTRSSGSDYSITMEELQEAIRKRKKIFVFILNDVFTENFTYYKNMDSGNFQPYHVDDIKVHEFIYLIKSTLTNSPILPFSSVSDITTHLRLQFAGMFQHLLSMEATATESKTYFDLNEVASRIRNLTTVLSEELIEFFFKFKSCVFAISFPIRRLLKILGINNFQVLAPNYKSIKSFLEYIGYKEREHELPFGEPYIYEKEFNGGKYTIELNENLFEPNGDLKDIRDEKILEEYIKFSFSKEKELDDDLPF